MGNLIKLRILKDTDIDLFRKWLYTEHVALWYHEPLDWINEIEKRDSEFNWLNHYIVEYDNKPIGFCQYYEYFNSCETWHGDIDVKGTYSIDYMIGEANYLGKGLGKEIIRALILIIEQHNNAERIIVQPEQENKASCGALLSCGFQFDNRNEVYIRVL